MDLAALGQYYFFEIEESIGIFFGSDFGTRKNMIVNGLGFKSPDPTHQILYLSTHGSESSVDMRMADGEFREVRAGEFLSIAEKVGLLKQNYEAVVVLACEAGMEFVPELSSIWPRSEATGKKPIFFGCNGAVLRKSVPADGPELERFKPDIFNGLMVAHEGSDFAFGDLKRCRTEAKNLLGEEVLDRVANLVSKQVSPRSEFKVTSINPVEAKKSVIVPPKIRATSQSKAARAHRV